MNYKNEKAERFIKSYIGHFHSAKTDKWNYEDGCVLNGAVMMYHATKDESYKQLVLNYLSKYINEDGSINYYKEEDYNIDNISIGTVLLFAYDETGEEKYRKAIEVLMNQVRKQPRTKEGNFWDKEIEPNYVSLDGLYMGQVFYMAYETRFGGKEHYSDIIKQFKNVRKYMFDDEKKLYNHAYDFEKQQPWTDKKTGLSENFWLSSMGWYLLALIDTMSVMEQPVYEYYRDLQDLFLEALRGLLQYQDKETGLFYQVIDKKGENKNCLETSGSVMVAYAILKACRMKVVLAEKYEAKAFKILDTVIDTQLQEIDSTIAGPFMMAYAEALIK